MHTFFDVLLGDDASSSNSPDLSLLSHDSVDCL